MKINGLGLLLTPSRGLSDEFRLSLRFPLCSGVKDQATFIRVGVQKINSACQQLQLRDFWPPLCGDQMRCVAAVCNPKHPHLRMVLVLRKLLGLAIGNHVHPHSPLQEPKDDKASLLLTKKWQSWPLANKQASTKVWDLFWLLNVPSSLRRRTNSAIEKFQVTWNLCATQNASQKISIAERWFLSGSSGF